MDKLFLACADTQLPSELFDKTLAEFSETARHVRGESLQEVGKMIFQQIMNPDHKGDPISFIPVTSTITLMGNGGVVVKEQGAEEIEERKRFLEALPKRSKNENEATAKFERLVNKRRPDFFWQTVATLKPRKGVS